MNLRRSLIPALATALSVCAFLAPAAGAQSACPNADLQPTASNMAEMRAATLCLLNAERTPRGLGALRENAVLTAASQAYSQKMVAERFFAHVTPSGVNLTERLMGVGYLNDSADWIAGENLAWGQTTLATPAQIMVAWMNSPGHRANVLESRYREVGLGIVLGTPAGGAADNGATYTTDFGAVEAAPTASPAASAAPVATATAKRKASKRKACAAMRRKAARSASARKKLARSRCARKASRRAGR